MPPSPERGFQPQPEQERPSPQEVVFETPQGMRVGAEKLVNMFASTFEIDGKEHLDEVKAMRREKPDQRFVITGSHLSNLDVPAAIHALGENFNFQIAAESLLFGLTPQQLMMNAAGKENFTPLQYKKSKDKGGKRTVFDPDNFDALAESMDKAKTPWIAIHPFTTEERMPKASVGPVYLAQKTGSAILPTALELHGGSVSLEGLKGLLKGATKKGEARFHIGKPIVLEPIDVTPIEEAMRKRERGERVSKEEIQHMRETHRKLQEQAEMIAMRISAMLPEEQRGVYGEDTKETDIEDTE